MSLESEPTPTFQRKGGPSNALLFSQLAVLNLLWAPVNLMVRVAQGAGFSGAGIGLVRWSFICVGLFALLSVPRFRSLVKPRWPQGRSALICIGIGLLLIGPAHLLYYVTLAHVPTTEGAVINTTAPFWVAILAWVVLRERINLQIWFAIGLGAVGTYVVSVGFGLPDLGATQGHLGSSLLYLLGTLIESLGGVFAIYVVRRSSGISVFALETVGTAAAAILIPMLFPHLVPLAVPHLGVGWLPLAYLILGAGITAFGGWYVLSERSPLSLMVVSIAIQPPVAALLGYFFLGEALNWPTAVGTSFVLFAVFVAAFERRQEAPSQPAELS